MPVIPKDEDCSYHCFLVFCILRCPRISAFCFLQLLAMLLPIAVVVAEVLSNAPEVEPSSSQQVEMFPPPVADAAVVCEEGPRMPLASQVTAVAVFLLGGLLNCRRAAFVHAAIL